MIYSHGLYSKSDLAHAKPVVSSLGGFVFAKCLTTRSELDAPSIAVIKYDELYAWNHCKPANVRFRWIKPAEHNVIHGARDALREAAKQFRVTNNSGHAAMCDNHADEIEILISMKKRKNIAC
jgi:hypothetical protein